MCKNNCCECKHAFMCPSENDVCGEGYDMQDWYCNHPSLKSTQQHGFKNIEYYMFPNEKVDQPDWCPMLKELNQLDKKEPIKRKTYQEKNEILEKIPGFATFESIEVGKIYHLPPLNTTVRGDLLIVSKSEYSITARELNLEKPNQFITRYLYKSMPNTWKFLVPHKIMHLEAKPTT